MQRKFLTYVFLIGFWFAALGQCPESVRRIGEEQYLSGHYQLALDAFLLCAGNRPENIELQLKIGVCYYHTNQFEKAITELRKVASRKSKYKSEALFYIGRSKHQLHEFQEAVAAYKTFLEQSESNHPLRTSVKEDILRCANGIRWQKKAGIATVYNVGKAVNSPEDEFKPMLNPQNPDCLLFSTNRLGSAFTGFKTAGFSIFQSCLLGGDWNSSLVLKEPFLNSYENDVVAGFAADGSVYLFRSKNERTGHLYKIKPEIEKPVLPSLQITPFNSTFGDRDPFFMNDSTLFFTSSRPGGYGGYDIYKATLVNGFWSQPENLGNQINTHYDEVSPWMASDEKTIYFSTNDTGNSIGGYDIVKSIFNTEIRAWGVPENLGVEINSAADDLYWFGRSNGKEAFYASSGRMSLGGLDIFSVLFEKPEFVLTTDKNPQAPMPGESETSVDVTPITSNMETHQGTIFYAQSGSIETAGIEKIVHWSNQVKLYPDTRVIFVVHSGASDDFPDFTRKIISDLLTKIPPTLRQHGNLRILNVGSRYPFSDKKGDNLNQRIELFVSGSKEQTYTPFDIRKQDIGPGAQYLRDLMEVTSYRIVFYGKDEKARKLFIKSVPGYFEETSPTEDAQRLSSGFYLTHGAAEQAFQNLVGLGIVQIKIVTCEKGWPSE